jgi:[acyl-carrier-protein] S-malonyltransferase
MTLAFIIDGGLNDPPGTGSSLYEAFPEVRAAYERVGEWTGLPASRLLSWELTRSTEYQQVGGFRQAALVFGLCDLLAAYGVRPGLVAGMSRGALLGAALAGAVQRRAVVGLLDHLRSTPPAPGRAQGLAQLFVPSGVEPEQFVGGFPDGVYVAGEIGQVGGGVARLYLLSGYQDSLQKLAGQLTDKTALRIPPDVNTAFHSPLRRHIADHQEPYLAGMDFRDPEVVCCGGLAPGEYSTAQQVRDLFRRNHTEPISLPLLVAALERNGTDRAVLLGPGLAEIWRGSVKFPVVHLNSPDDLAQVLDAVGDGAMS